jgi:hypothetical protein
VAAPAQVSVWAAVSLAAEALAAAGPEAVVARAVPAEPAEPALQLIPETCGVPRGKVVVVRQE